MTTDLPARLEAALTARFTELGNPFSEMRRHEQGPDGWPASHPVGPHLVAEVLRELLPAAPVAAPAPAVRPELRDQIATTVEDFFEAWRTGLGDVRPQDALTDALVAVPPPSAGRAAVLTVREKSMLGFALEMAQEEIHARMLEIADADQNALTSLRRLAAETAAPDAHPPHHRWYVETRDGLADQWAPGMRFTERDAAVERYQTVSEHHPLWKDGTPVERRLVRETTSYTVEQPATAPAVVQTEEARQCPAVDIAYGRCIRPVHVDGGECFHAEQPIRIDEETDEDTLCGSEYPGDDNFVGQLCGLPKGHFGEHRCDEQFAGTGYTALLRWASPSSAAGSVRQPDHTVNEEGTP